MRQTNDDLISIYMCLCVSLFIYASRVKVNVISNRSAKLHLPLCRDFFPHLQNLRHEVFDFISLFAPLFISHIQPTMIHTHLFFMKCMHSGSCLSQKKMTSTQTIHTSIFYTCLIRRSGRGGAGAYPSCHRGRGGVHPGQVASPSQGHTETNETNNHTHAHNHS